MNDNNLEMEFKTYGSVRDGTFSYYVFIFHCGELKVNFASPYLFEQVCKYIENNDYTFKDGYKFAALDLACDDINIIGLLLHETEIGKEMDFVQERNLKLDIIRAYYHSIKNRVDKLNTLK